MGHGRCGSPTSPQIEMELTRLERVGSGRGPVVAAGADCRALVAGGAEDEGSTTKRGAPKGRKRKQKDGLAGSTFLCSAYSDDPKLVQSCLGYALWDMRRCGMHVPQGVVRAWAGTRSTRRGRCTENRTSQAALAPSASPARFLFLTPMREPTAPDDAGCILRSHQAGPVSGGHGQGTQGLVLPIPFGGTRALMRCCVTIVAESPHVPRRDRWHDRAL